MTGFRVGFSPDPHMSFPLTSSDLRREGQGTQLLRGPAGPSLCPGCQMGSEAWPFSVATEQPLELQGGTEAKVCCTPWGRRQWWHGKTSALLRPAPFPASALDGSGPCAGVPPGASGKCPPSQPFGLCFLSLLPRLLCGEAQKATGKCLSPPRLCCKCLCSQSHPEPLLLSVALCHPPRRTFVPSQPGEPPGGQANSIGAFRDSVPPPGTGMGQRQLASSRTGC